MPYVVGREDKKRKDFESFDSIGSKCKFFSGVIVYLCVFYPAVQLHTVVYISLYSFKLHCFVFHCKYSSNKYSTCSVISRLQVTIFSSVTTLASSTTNQKKP